MSASEDSKSTSGVATKEQVIDGFKAIGDVYRNIASHIDAYALWIEKQDMTEAALQMQVELISTLHSKFQ